MRKGQALSYGQQGSRQDFARGGADARPERPMPLWPGVGGCRGPPPQWQPGGRGAPAF